MEQYNKPLDTIMDENETQKRLFVLGLIILFCWVIVIILCAYPQLFRDLLLQYVCCCFAGFAVRRRTKCQQRADKLAKARKRVRSASKSFITVSTAVTPSAIMLQEIALSELRPNKSTMGRHRISMSEPICELDPAATHHHSLLESGEGHSRSVVEEAQQRQPAKATVVPFDGPF
uniref:Uncharacterized protein n=1 Tax=Globodera rostochiensis TaxID=31243 RepID=A0A914HE41_GLORO